MALALDLAQWKALQSKAAHTVRRAAGAKRFGRQPLNMDRHTLPPQGSRDGEGAKQTLVARPMESSRRIGREGGLILGQSTVRRGRNAAPVRGG